MRERILGALAAAVLVAACAGGTDRRDGSPSGTLTVLAAASLEGALTEVAAAFEARHPNVEVALSADGSARLATAILEGAPADVFASADDETMERVARADRLSPPSAVIATNRLAIVVPDGNPRGIARLGDLVRPGLRLALCRPAVPCGRYAALAFARADVDLPAADQQDSVTGVLTRVQLGEADAGLVYRTDVAAADGVQGIALPPNLAIEATYPASVLADAPNPIAAAAFIAFLQGADAQAILARFGFGPP